MIYSTLKDLRPDGGELRLRFDVFAVSDIEAFYDRGILEILRVQAGVRSTMIFAWAGLKHDDPKITPQKVGEWMQDAIDSERSSAMEIQRQVFLAFFRSGVLQGLGHTADIVKERAKAAGIDLDAAMEAAVEEGDARPTQGGEGPPDERTADKPSAGGAKPKAKPRKRGKGGRFA